MHLIVSFFYSFFRAPELRIFCLGSTPNAADALRWQVGCRYCLGASGKRKHNLYAKSPAEWHLAVEKGNKPVTFAFLKPRRDKSDNYGLVALSKLHANAV